MCSGNQFETNVCRNDTLQLSIKKNLYTIPDYREAFGLFDRVGDSKVAFNQIADIMRALGQNPTNKEVALILGNPTADGMWICFFFISYTESTSGQH